MCIRDRYYIALYDDEWLRAKLLSFTDDEDCEILLVDSGNKTIVAKDEVKNIQPKFLKLPFQVKLFFLNFVILFIFFK